MILGMAVAAMVVESEEDSYELYRNRFIIRHTHTTPPISWSKISPSPSFWSRKPFLNAEKINV